MLFGTRYTGKKLYTLNSKEAAMAIGQANCMRRFIDMCENTWKKGWHEGTSGNLSYRLTEEDIRVCMPYLSVKGEGHDWRGLGYQDFELGETFYLVTAAGSAMRKVSGDPARNCGIVEIDADGKAWRCMWGFEGGGKPTSEFDTHLKSHSAMLRDGDGDNRVIYHAHTPNITALSLLLETNEKAWNRILWGAMTEVVMVAPQGVGVLPWMMPGSVELADQTARQIYDHDAVVWTQHGIVIREQNFDDAFGLAHTLEKAAGIYLTARAANGGREPEHLCSLAHVQDICESLGYGFVDQQ